MDCLSQIDAFRLGFLYSLASCQIDEAHSSNLLGCVAPDIDSQESMASWGISVEFLFCHMALLQTDVEQFERLFKITDSNFNKAIDIRLFLAVFSNC